MANTDAIVSIAGRREHVLNRRFRFGINVDYKQKLLHCWPSRLDLRLRGLGGQLVIMHLHTCDQRT